MEKKKFKIQGIPMTVTQWFNMFKDPYKSEALLEIKNSGSYVAQKTQLSLTGALNRFNWDDSIKGRAYWSKIHDDLHNNRQEQYMDYDTITQIID
jgi:hypothetical protein|tara:strand:+ start:10278 stop:10562 length:285 start_codon:yes stop_codon:yes gene_type:complete